MSKRPRRIPLPGVLAGLLLLSSALAADEAERPSGVSTVGMPARLDAVVFDGPELEVKPIEDRREPLVLRIAEVYPHGTARRYDLVYHGLEPGTYNLADYLRRKDGSPAGQLPRLLVRVDPVLPPGQVEPHGLTLASAPWLGGYRLVLGLAGSLWFAGLVAILVLGRRKRSDLAAVEARRTTLADRLAPLVDAARDGTLSQVQSAELERLLIGYWRRRLDLDHAGPAQAMTAMKAHPEAGPLFRQLEEWLHRPGTSHAAVDVASLLEPYRTLPAEGEIDPADSPLPAQRPVAAGGHAR